MRRSIKSLKVCFSFVILEKKGELKIKAVFDSFLDPKKSFDLPFKTGLEGEEVILGRYTPTIDSMALLMDTKRFSFKDIAKDIFKTTDPLEKATQAHEFLGHFELTKRSPIWAWLYYYNYYSYFIFLNFIKMMEKDVVKNHLISFRHNMIELLKIKDCIDFIIERWKVVQETRANIYLLALKKKIKDSDIKKKIEALIRISSHKSEDVEVITKFAEHFMSKIGVQNTLKLFDSLTILASSISYRKNFGTPQDDEEFQKMRNDDFNYGVKSMTEDPAMIDPAIRFFELIGVITKLIPQIKKSLSRGSSSADLAYHMGCLMGYKIDTLDENTKYLIELFSSIANNERINNQRRIIHRNIEEMTRIFQEITKYRGPTFWFINDIDSEKILFIKGKIAEKYPGELEHYLHYSVLKYQFLKSMERDKNFIGCFENKLSICRSKCNSCLMNKGFKLTKKLYKTTSNLYSYDELVKEAMESRDAGSAIFK